MTKPVKQPSLLLLRTFMYYAVSAIAAVPFILASPLMVLPIRFVWPFAKLYLRMQLFFLKTTCGITHEVIGTENIPDGPVIFASQHQSSWENLFYQFILGNPAMFAKKEIFSYPIVGSFAKRNDHIVVDRSGSLDDLRGAFQKGLAISKTGRNLLIYPSGTRDPRHRNDIRSGIGVLYQLVGRPVVPILLNSEYCWPQDSWMKYPGVITIRILPEIPAGLARRDMLEQLREKLSQRL